MYRPRRLRAPWRLFSRLLYTDDLSAVCYDCDVCSVIPGVSRVNCLVTCRHVYSVTNPHVLLSLSSSSSVICLLTALITTRNDPPSTHCCRNDRSDLWLLTLSKCYCYVCSAVICKPHCEALKCAIGIISYSIRLSYSGVVSKRLNPTSSNFFHRARLFHILVSQNLTSFRNCDGSSLAGDFNPLTPTVAIWVRL